MKQVGVDLCGLTEVNGYFYLIVCIDYFCKWSDEKPIADRAVPTTAWLLYDTDEWLGQRICQRDIWWASSSYRCSPACYKYL